MSTREMLVCPKCGDLVPAEVSWHHRHYMNYEDQLAMEKSQEEVRKSLQETGAQKHG